MDNFSKGGRDRWVRVDDLSPEGKSLLNFEIDEVVHIKGIKFSVTAIALDKPVIELTPVSR